VHSHSRAAGTGWRPGPGLLPDASRALAGRRDSGPYRQVGQPLTRSLSGQLERHVEVAGLNDPEAAEVPLVTSVGGSWPSGCPGRSPRCTDRRTLVTRHDTDDLVIGREAFPVRRGLRYLPQAAGRPPRRRRRPHPGTDHPDPGPPDPLHRTLPAGGCRLRCRVRRWAAASRRASSVTVRPWVTAALIVRTRPRLGLCGRPAVWRSTASERWLGRGRRGRSTSW
jgi:hypothetical protein